MYLSYMTAAEGGLYVERESGLTSKRSGMALDITVDQLLSWVNDGVLAQFAFPHLTPEEREFIITGMSLEEQRNIWPAAN